MKKNVSNKKESLKEISMKKVKADNVDDSIELDKIADNMDSMDISPEKILIIEEIFELLSNDDIANATNKFHADSEEKEIALEYANSHIQFLNEIVENDYTKGIERTEVEIRDIISHINALLKKRDEYLFTTIVVHSPSHYRNIQKKFMQKIKNKKK